MSETGKSPQDPPATDPATNMTESRRKSSSSLGNSGRRNSMGKRRSSLFAAARASFVRTRGQSGASVETLRGTSGADFEGYANVHRGAGSGDEFFDMSLCCFASCFGKKDGLYFLLIKGYHCFVFKDEDGKSPKYAIELMNRKAVIQPSHSSFIPHVPHPGAEGDTTYTTIHLETGLGDVEYKFTFANTNKDGSSSKASAFCAAVSTASSEASTEQVRKRLGHEALLKSKRSSVRYANNIGVDKAKEQPEAPLGAGEVLSGMPATETYI